MTTKEIQKIIAKAQVEKGHSPVIENFTYLPFEMDVMSISGAGFMYEFEVKISRQDFKKDIGKEKKHKSFLNANQKPFTDDRFYSDISKINNNIQNIPNYFYYVCGEGLIKAPDLPSYAGLIYIIDGSIVEQKKAPLIHKYKHDLQPLLKKVCRVQAERLYLGGCKMTVKNKAIKSRREERLIEAGFTGELLTKALKK